MKNFILLFLLLSSTAYAQDEADQLEKEKDQLEEWIEKNDKWEVSQRSAIETSEAGILKAKLEVDKANTLIKKRKPNIEAVKSEVEAAHLGMSVAIRLVSRKGAFYRCVRDNITNIGVADTAQCKFRHPASFTSDELKQIAAWSDLADPTEAQLRLRAEKVNLELREHEQNLQAATRNLSNAVAMKRRFEVDMKLLEAREVDIKVIKKHQKFVNCDANTPDVSLEEELPYPDAEFKGPFFGVPRDNQDGLGTCYANTAKNLLVGTSRGEDIASFLDVALVYQGAEGVSTNGLDAGESCTALAKLKEKGFCKQTDAPIEAGEVNTLAEGLIGQNKENMYDQAGLVKSIQRFLAGQEAFKKSNKEYSEQVLKQSKMIVDNLNLRPNVKIPLPVVRHQIPGAWLISDTHTYVVSKSHPSVSLDAFTKEFQAEYRKFYPVYVRSVMEGKTREEIFDIYTNKMNSFITKYGLQGQLAAWKNSWMGMANSDASDPNLKKDIADSVDFMKVMAGKEGSTTEEFLKFCDDNMGDSMLFMASLEPLLKVLKNKGVSSDALFDKDGKFRSGVDLLQLAIAPACINPANRVPISQDFTCDSGYLTVQNIKAKNLPYPERVKLLREKVVASLMQGYPLGNTFGHHINTIVGMRYNKETESCQYKIRESQDGTSKWQSESAIYDVIRSLTQVRRK